ncbi:MULTISPECIES: LysE family translocator [unclassified Actinopolyspora]|uniref:LysE family transporter n=1 Tax=unclassified Actinopolyspora TaxID=2639451 RepID=UPI0013F69674|nr:LysE family translocator [Actinopolyspora sp. BKK2]NHE77924.1 LysE family translocator [Actinopolyspora sp. BKK1]
MPDQLVPFLLLTVLITITPGADMALGIRNSLRGGSAACWWTGLGCCTGLVVHAVVSVAGLSALLAASATAYTVLKVVGACYLIWLGVRSLISTLRGGRGTIGADADRGCSTTADEPKLALSTAYRQGLISNLLNPKIVVLFLTLLPQFVGNDEPHTITSLQLALVFVVTGLLWWRVLSWLLAGLQGLLSRKKVRSALESITGAVLIALGLRVALGAWRTAVR